MQRIEVEPNGSFEKRLGGSGWLLVRPDGYLLMRGRDNGDDRGVEFWLQRWLAKPAEA